MISGSCTTCGSSKKNLKKLATSKKIFFNLVRPTISKKIFFFELKKLRFKHDSRCPRATQIHLLGCSKCLYNHVSISQKKVFQAKFSLFFDLHPTVKYTKFWLKNFFFEISTYGHRGT